MDNEEITKKTGVAERQEPDTAIEKSYEIRSIPIEQIKVADFCRRRALKKDLKSLTESIQRRGLIQSPVVLNSNNGSYSLIAGSRRFQACKALSWKTIPALRKAASSISMGPADENFKQKASVEPNCKRFCHY